MKNRFFMRNHNQNPNQCPNATRKVLSLVETFIESVREAQEIIREQQRCGSSEADLKLAMARFGMGHISVEQFLEADTPDKMLDCISPVANPEAN